MAKTDHAENAILNHIFRGVAFPSLTNLHVALFTAAPGETGGGTEVTGGGYARQSIARNTSNWKDPSTATQGQVSNTNEIAFPVASADYPAPVTHVALMDAATGGNMWYYGALSSSVTINQNGQFKFLANQLVISEN